MDVMVAPMPTGSRHAACERCAGKQHGFSYIGLLLMIAIAGVGLAAVGMRWHQQLRVEKEKQLLFVGHQYRAAIASYQAANPNGPPLYPASLEDLLLDKRYPGIKRHLRKLYADPITGSAEWGLIRQHGRIIGIYSLSTEKPVKQAGFASDDRGFKAAKSYRQWVFGQELLESEDTVLPLARPIR
jgi:type II secretory pathway pseudopilin PulG